MLGVKFKMLLHLLVHKGKEINLHYLAKNKKRCHILKEMLLILDQVRHLPYLHNQELPMIKMDDNANNYLYDYL